MFEMQGRKSQRMSQGKHHSNSRSKLNKKDQPNQKIIIDVVRTEGTLKDKKAKSQCLSKERHERKSIDVSKLIQTTRSIGSKKSKERTQKLIRPHEQLFTQDKPRHQSYIISNLTTEKSAELKWNKKGSLKKVTQGRSAERKKAVWNEKDVPISWQTALDRYSHLLTKYEQSQIKQYKKIYYLGHKAAKRERIDGSGDQFDNQDKEYRFVQNDHIAYRYEVLSIIGKGSYGQVFKVLDHKTKLETALKIIKNDPKFSKQAFIQIKILSHIKEQDEEQQANIVRIKDFVIFRKHVCILFQLLSSNLYELIIRNNYNGLNEQLIRRFAIQMLVSLQFLRSQKIIHCDLKPENILLKEYNKSGIKLIDFGSSCFQNETIYTYIQSRYYRAPEITLGIPYGSAIDLWSTGCILAELFTGVPVFPGQNELQQMKYMTDALGLPSKTLLARGSRKNIFFQETGKVRHDIQSITTTIQMFSKPLKQRIEDADFLAFIEAFLKWAPEERITPVEALNHPWIRKGLPEQLKTKLGGSYKMLKGTKETKQSSSSNRIKTKSRQRGGSVIKLTSRASQEKIPKKFGIRF